MTCTPPDKSPLDSSTLAGFFTTMLLLPFSSSVTPRDVTKKIDTAFLLHGLDTETTANAALRHRIIMHLTRERGRLVNAFRALGDQRVKDGLQRYQCECLICDSIKAADDIYASEAHHQTLSQIKNDHWFTTMLEDISNGAKASKETVDSIDAFEKELQGIFRTEYKGLSREADAIERGGHGHPLAALFGLLGGMGVTIIDLEGMAAEHPLGDDMPTDYIDAKLVENDMMLISSGPGDEDDESDEEPEEDDEGEIPDHANAE